MKKVIKRVPCKLVCKWPNVNILSKQTIITILLVIIAMTGQAQTKTATVTGYSPALKDGTLVFAGTDSPIPVVDTVQAGRFAYTLPVEKFTESYLSFMGEGCPNSHTLIFLRPGVTVKVTGSDCFNPLWKVDSPIPEQQTQNRLTEYCRDVLTERMQMDLAKESHEKRDSVTMKWMKQQMDILPSLPVDAATVRALLGISETATYTKDFPYMEQLKEVEKTIAARAPKGFEEKLAEIHYNIYPPVLQMGEETADAEPLDMQGLNNIYPPRVLHVGEEAVDTELFDMQGKKHHLFEAFANGKYVLLDFWDIGCGPCRKSEPEMREIYKRMNGKLEIVGINLDKLSTWQKNYFSSRIVWKNWNDGKMGNSAKRRYHDSGAVPYYVLISPDKRIVWKAMGYGPGLFFGMADAINSLRQDNSANLQLAIRQVDTDDRGTTIRFRYYCHKNYWFRIVKDSYLEANGKKYKLTAADGIKLDENNFPTEKATDAAEEILSDLRYSDFTLTFEPFENIPTTFDFKEGDSEGAFVIHNISVE